MKKHKNILFMLSVLFTVALACTLPNTVPAPTFNIDATLISLAFTQTAAGNQPEVEQSDSEQPIYTATATLMPTITPTLAPSIPSVSVSIDTNCRTGPGKIYDYLTALVVGETAEVIGKYTSTSPSYWIITKDSFTCWLWGKYATVEGETSNLPEMIPPPSPTPTITPTNTATATPTGPNFVLSYEGISHCSPGDDYAILKWVNSGSVVFESAQVEIQDLNTTLNLFGPSFSNSPFGTASPGCGVGNSNLGVGNTAYSSYYIGTPAPAGHNIRITVTLCSQDNMNGDCLTLIKDGVLP